MNKPQWNTIHYSELGPAQPGSPVTVEWDVYRREVGRLIAEGHEGKHVLIKGEKILGIFDTHEEATGLGDKLFLLEPCLIQQIQTRERVYRVAPIYWMSVGKEQALRELRESANGCSSTNTPCFHEGGGI